MYQVHKNFTFDGIAYKIGDSFTADKIPQVKLRALGAARFIVPGVAKPKKKIFKSKKDKA